MLKGKRILIMNLYAPNNEDLGFFDDLLATYSEYRDWLTLAHSLGWGF